ncbi:hypothetical protein MOQ_003451 [Trypanosoma cruzi marinkellei]|uniref:Uncharacterized protein n=1 Tax=Trypanosoma cruzi marinkellei TaxID=85056 RepID=K2N051_TRYCR|nr:hypothetical protein MOQ_003451 [Trypanosoma cruzi marinkellei]
MNGINDLHANADPFFFLQGETERKSFTACGAPVLDGENRVSADDGRSTEDYGNSSQRSTDAPVEECWRRNRVLLEGILSDSFFSTLPSEVSTSGRCNVSLEALQAPRVVRKFGSYVVDPVHMKLSAVDALLSRAAQGGSGTESSETKKTSLPQSLPQKLNVPLALRCAFCQRFDSLCSNCHRNWKEVIRKRQRVVALQGYCRLPEERRCGLLFMTAAYGVGEFAAMQLEFDGEKCFKWRSVFFPLTNGTTERQRSLVKVGEVHALHVAFAYDRVDVAECLLAHPRCLMPKSEHHVDILNFLPQPLIPQWEAVLNNSNVYVSHLLVEQAKRLRRAEDWEGAEALYAELLQRKPDSEHAHSGWAKMRYDQGYVVECINLCDSMISGETLVDWNEFSLESIKSLREASLERYHEYCHQAETEGVLKACGCVILDKVRIPIRRLPFSIIVDRIFLFCDGVSLWSIFKSTRMPLLRTVCEKLNVLLPKWCLQTLLMREPGFQGMSDKLLCQLPSSVGQLAVSPVRPLGVSVVAMADFNMFLVRAYAACFSAKTVKNGFSALSLFGFGRKESKDGRQAPHGATEIVISKQYRIYRLSVEEPWCVKETGEWEVEELSVEALESQLLQVKNLIDVK